MLTHDASPKTSKARKTAGRVAARKRRACQWEWPGGRAIDRPNLLSLDSYSGALRGPRANPERPLTELATQSVTNVMKQGSIPRLRS